MSVHMSSKPADEASRLPAAAWLVLGIVLVAEVMDLLDSTITTIALAAGSAFTYRYLTRQPTARAQQAQKPEPAQHGRGAA